MDIVVNLPKVGEIILFFYPFLFDFSNFIHLFIYLSFALPLIPYLILKMSKTYSYLDVEAYPLRSS